MRKPPAQRRAHTHICAQPGWAAPDLPGTLVCGPTGSPGAPWHPLLLLSRQRKRPGTCFTRTCWQADSCSESLCAHSPSSSIQEPAPPAQTPVECAQRHPFPIMGCCVVLAFQPSKEGHCSHTITYEAKKGLKSLPNVFIDYLVKRYAESVGIGPTGLSPAEFLPVTEFQVRDFIVYKVTPMFPTPSWHHT